MSRMPHALVGDRRGIAAVEFALVAPMLALLLGNVADFGLLIIGKSQLANGMAQATQYALLRGPSVSGASVQAMVRNGSSRAGLGGTVTATVTGPACYCVTGQPPALSAPPAALSGTYTCTGVCAVTGATPSPYVIITGSYTYQPIMPNYSGLISKVVSENVTAKLQ